MGGALSGPPADFVLMGGALSGPPVDFVLNVINLRSMILGVNVKFNVGGVTF